MRVARSERDVDVRFGGPTPRHGEHLVRRVDAGDARATRARGQSPRGPSRSRRRARCARSIGREESGQDALPAIPAISRPIGPLNRSPSNDSAIAGSA